MNFKGHKGKCPWPIPSFTPPAATVTVADRDTVGHIRSALQFLSQNRRNVNRSRENRRRNAAQNDTVVCPPSPFDIPDRSLRRGATARRRFLDRHGPRRVFRCRRSVPLRLKWRLQRRTNWTRNQGDRGRGRRNDLQRRLRRRTARTHAAPRVKQAAHLAHSRHRRRRRVEHGRLRRKRVRREGRRRPVARDDGVRAGQGEREL